jgi:Tfp pilus assembly protein PilV
MCGAGLIDVLIAMLVLMGGVAGLARLQAVSLRDGSASLARGHAARLAEAKFDDLRSFTQLEAGAKGTFGYDELGADAGGAENGDGMPRVPSGDVTVGNTRFQRHWQARPLYACTNGEMATTPCSGSQADARPDLYALSIVLSWNNVDGTSDLLTLDGSVRAADPSLATRWLLSAYGEGPSP